MRVLVFIVAYNAEAHIESVLRRIPAEIWDQRLHETEVLLLDDRSGDRTIETSSRYRDLHGKYNLTVLSNPINQGYGGNQKLGYWYAIQHGFDAVILLHGDGQYAPEILPEFIRAFEDPSVDAVFGSRMMRPRSALRGGMPLYKYLGNRVLTTLQNRLLKQSLSEFHSGYRGYRVSALEALPFEFNSPDFDFDTDIIIQLIDTGRRIAEIPIPTYYGNEICRVNGVKYAIQVLSSTVRSRLQRIAVAYHPKFDYSNDNQHYTLKLGQPSSHEWAMECCRPGQAVLDLGCGPGLLSSELARRGCYVMGVDKCPQDNFPGHWFHEADLDEPLFEFDVLPRHPDVVLCLDVIEHLRSPERFLLDLRERLSAVPGSPRVILTTPNVAFALTRVSLLLGRFSYGKRGILDLTHTRLFTRSSLQQMLAYLGYEVRETRGIPAPLELVFGSGFWGRLLNAVNSRLVRFWPSLFAYQIMVSGRALPTLRRLLEDAREHVGRHHAESAVETVTQGFPPSLDRRPTTG